jgi:outer membrane protein assembly factor BamB
MVALNKKTGETIWKCAVPGGDEAAYASVIILQAGGSKQYVQFLQHGLVGVEAKTGKFLWRYDKTAKGSAANIPTPVADDGAVYSGAGRSGAALVKINARDNGFEAQEVYFSPKLPTAIGGAIKIGKYLYGTTGQAMMCVDFATGEVKWEERGLAPAALCYADGRFYLHGENGEAALVEASPEGYHEKGRMTPPDHPTHSGMEKAWAYPVVADGKLYVRDANSLWAYDVKSR